MPYTVYKIFDFEEFGTSVEFGCDLTQYLRITGCRSCIRHGREEFSCNAKPCRGFMSNFYVWYFNTDRLLCSRLILKYDQYISIFFKFVFSTMVV